MIISMILITKICLNLPKLPGLGRSKACNWHPGQELRQGWVLRQPLLAGSCTERHQIPITASSAGSSTPLEQSAKVLFFPSSSLNHLCCGRSQTTAVCSEFESMPSTKDLQSVLSHAEQNKN